jgi:hypothetical protein
MGKNLLRWDEDKKTFYEIDCPQTRPWQSEWREHSRPQALFRPCTAVTTKRFTHSSVTKFLSTHIRTNVSAGKIVNGDSFCFRPYMIYGLVSVNGHHFFRSLFAYAIAHPSCLIEPEWKFSENLRSTLTTIPRDLKPAIMMLLPRMSV